jgi:hypothetical protein
MNMAGYPLVLPDMIGGNGYGDEGFEGEQQPPNEEIFIRWLQANTFMPSLQFSYVPWQYGAQVSLLFYDGNICGADTSTHFFISLFSFFLSSFLFNALSDNFLSLYFSFTLPITVFISLYLSFILSSVHFFENSKRIITSFTVILRL